MELIQGMPSNKKDYIQKKYEDLQTEYEHLKLVATVYNEFHKEKKFEYVFGGMDFFTNQNNKDKSWDILLYSKEQLKDGWLLPIFIEAKGQDTIASKYEEDLTCKIEITEKILEDPVSRETYFRQPGIQLDVTGINYMHGTAEYVVLLNDLDFQTHFIDPKSGLINGLPLNLVWWVVSSVGVGKQSVSLPYGTNNGIPEWKNCNKTGFCKHNSSKLNDWLSKRKSIRLDQIPIPCKSGTLSKALKIAVLLNTAELFPKQNTALTRETLKMMIMQQFSRFGCLDHQEDYVELLIDEMVKLKVIKRDKKDALRRYKLFGRKVFRLSKGLGIPQIAKDEDILFYLATNSWDSNSGQGSLDSYLLNS